MATEVQESVDAILGEEFLTWLWYTSDTAPSFFEDASGGSFSVYMEQRIVVQSGAGPTRETTSVSGALSPLREARFGLGTGKKVSRATIRLEKDGMDFQLSLRASDFAIGGLKTPKIEKHDEDDPDGILLEKIYLIQTCMRLINDLFSRFLSQRLSAGWPDVVCDIRQWLART